MERKKKIKVVVNKPRDEVLENIIVASIVKFTILRINRLPQNQRLSTLEEILKSLKN